MTNNNTGACFCGAVEIEVTGAPEAMGYCHCASCRSWSAGPVNAFTLWKPENVKVTKGANLVGHFKKTENSDRQFCTDCGGHLIAVSNGASGHGPGYYMHSGTDAGIVEYQYEVCTLGLLP